MSSSRRAYKQLQEQQKRLLAQQEELVNLDQGGGGDEAFAMEEDEDDHHRRRRASHSRRIIEVLGQIAKPRRAANIDRRRERRGKDLLEDYFIPNSVYPDHVCIYFKIAYAKNCKKQTFRDEVMRQNFSTVVNEKSRFNGYFNSDFDDFLQLHSLTLYEYNE